MQGLIFSIEYLSSKRYLSCAPSKKMCQHHFAAIDYRILLISRGTTSQLKGVGEQCQIGEGITSLKFQDDQHIIGNIASDGLELPKSLGCDSVKIFIFDLP